MVTVPMPQAVDILGLVTADLAVEQTRLGAVGACCLARCDPPPLVETVRLHEAAQRVVTRQRPEIGSRLGKCDEIVVMELDAPVFVCGVLCEDDLAHRGAHRGLPASIGTQLAAQNGDRVAVLLQGTVKPPFNGGKAEADRIASGGMTPLARR